MTTKQLQVISPYILYMCKSIKTPFGQVLLIRADTSFGCMERTSKRLIGNGYFWVSQDVTNLISSKQVL